MSGKSVNSMTRYELEQRYKEYGCDNYKLRTLDDLKNIHGFDVTELSGYDGLPQEQRELFDKTVIKFYNGRGLDIRNRLQPKSVNFVHEVSYTIPDNYPASVYDSGSNNGDGSYTDVGMDIFVINNDGKTIGKRLHRYRYDRSISIQKCKKVGRCFEQTYLRFELKDEWYHFTPNGDWY